MCDKQRRPATASVRGSVEVDRDNSNSEGSAASQRPAWFATQEEALVRRHRPPWAGVALRPTGHREDDARPRRRPGNGSAGRRRQGSPDRDQPPRTDERRAWAEPTEGLRAVVGPLADVG